MYPARRTRAGSSVRRLLCGASPLHRNVEDVVHRTQIDSSLRQFIAYYVQRHEHGTPHQRYRSFTSDVTTDDESSMMKSARSDDQTNTTATTKARSPDVFSALTTASLFSSQHPKTLLHTDARPQTIQHELSQLQKQLHHIIEVLEPKQHCENQNGNATLDSTSPIQTNPVGSQSHHLTGTNEPDLPPLAPPHDMKYTTIKEILSLPLSAWDDSVWNQGRWMFVQRFQSHCFILVNNSDGGQKQFDAMSAPSPLSTSYHEGAGSLTINEVQETLNLLQRLCQVRSDTKELHHLMNQFFHEVRVVIEWKKNLKVSNKQMRNEFQYHPAFVATESVTGEERFVGSSSNKYEKYLAKKEETINNFNSQSLGTVAHMIEATIYQIMKNRYWYPDTTTAYQTMIQVAAIATVDHKMHSTATSMHHNPGANAEYWLKQQHQASRMNAQPPPLHNSSSGAFPINAPNRYDYTTVLEGWVATSKIEQLYQHTYNPYDVSQHPSVMSAPNRNLDVFATALDDSPSPASSLYYDSSNDSLAASRAGQLIRQWQFLYSSSDNNPVLKPTESAYSCWLLCIVNSGNRTSKGAAVNAARECHNALKEISKRSEKDSFWPSVTLFNILMNAYAKAGDAEAAEAVLHDLIEKAKYNTYCVPDVVSFTTVINAWAQIPHNHAAPDRAERLFHLQQDFAIRSGLDSLLPTVTTVTAVLQCLVKSNSPLAPSRAEAILKQMHDMVKAGHPKLQPNVITYNICMNIWWRSGHVDASRKVEELYQELIDQYRASNYAIRFKPDIATYIARVSVWERDRTLTARAIAEKIESVFNELVSPVDAMSPTEEMKTIEATRKPRPNQAIYNVLIRAFSNCGDAVSATKYLEAMIVDYLDNQNYKAIPNRYVFHFVIAAWSKKLSYTGAETAEWWLNRMHHLSATHPALKDIAPNSVAYNTCLGAWARFPQGRMIIDTDPNIEAALYGMINDNKDVMHQESSVNQTQSLQSSTMTKCPTVIAMERGQYLFHRMKQNDIRPDVYTYGALLHIISNQKQCTKHVKYSQAQIIFEKMVRDNIEMNVYIYRLLRKCGINNLPNYNLSYDQRNSAKTKKPNVRDENRTSDKKSQTELLRENEIGTNEVAETL